MRHVTGTNVTGTLALIHAVGQRMRERGQGRIPVTGSIAGFVPGSFQAVYNGSKAFIDSFSFALRNELCHVPRSTGSAGFGVAGSPGEQELLDMLDLRADRRHGCLQCLARHAELGHPALQGGGVDALAGIGVGGGVGDAFDRFGLHGRPTGKRRAPLPANGTSIAERDASLRPGIE